MGRMVSTTVYLTVDQDKNIDRLSRDFEIPKAAIFRRGVDLAIDYYQGKAEALELGAERQVEDDAATGSPCGRPSRQDPRRKRPALLRR